MNVNKIKATITIVICLWVVAFFQLMSNKIFKPEGDITQVLAQTRFVMAKETLEVKGMADDNLINQLKNKEKDYQKAGYQIDFSHKKQGKETYIHFTITSWHDTKEMLTLQQELTKMTGLRVTLSVDGATKGIMQEDEKEKVVKNLFLRLGATMVKTRSDNYYIAYGYSSSIDDYVRMNGERVNISVAIIDSEDEGTTNMLISTPLINQDF